MINEKTDLLTRTDVNIPSTIFDTNIIQAKEGHAISSTVQQESNKGKGILKQKIKITTQKDFSNETNLFPKDNQFYTNHLNLTEMNNYQKKSSQGLINQNANESFDFSEGELLQSDEVEPSLIKKAKLIKDCTILKYGIKPSIELIDYTFCKTCDINLIHPICIPCITTCHVGHNIKKNYLRGHIKCVCGEKLHSFGIVNENEETISCLFQEWTIQSNLLTFYSTPSNTPLCIFCHHYCSNTFEQDKLIKETSKSVIPQCSCRSEKIHSEFKVMYEKIDCLIQDNTNIFVQNLQYIQLLNMIFKSKSSFNSIFANFDETIKKLTIMNDSHVLSANITSTNCYHSLNNFSTIASSNKHNTLRYWCKEVEEYFSFKNIEMILSKKRKVHDTCAYWSFMHKILFLFHKVYIGNKTQTMDKYKLYDLENISPMQRLALFHWNRDHFHESTAITKYCIETLSFFSLSGFSQIEAYDTIIEICAILKRLSEFSLIINSDMSLICLEIEKFFSLFSFIRKQNKTEVLWNKEKRWFFIVIKMLHYFIYTYNDRLIKNILTNKKTYPTLDSITFDNTQYLFDKTDLGRLISRITIRIMSTIQKYYSDKENTEIYQKIMRHGMKIMSYILYNYDSYLLSLNKIMKNGDYYLKIIEMTIETSGDYRIIYEQHQKIENAYRNYYSFEIDEDTLIRILDKTLEVINDVPNEKRNACVLKSNYFNSLTKVILVISFKEEEPNHQEFIKNLFKFYNTFIENSSDNSLLLFSHYILTTLMEVPNVFGVEVFRLINHGVKLISSLDSVMSFTKHLQKLTFGYLEKLRLDEDFKEINTCLVLFLEILYYLTLKIKCLNIEKTIVKTKVILKNLMKNYPQILDCFENISKKKCSEDEKKIILLYFKLLNNVFSSSNRDDRKILKEIIDRDDLNFLLRQYDIDLDIRTEILVFLRHNDIDIYYLNSNDENYANAIITAEDKLIGIKSNPLISYFKYPTKLFTFQKEMINISFKDGNSKNNEDDNNKSNGSMYKNHNKQSIDNQGYDFLNREMANCSQIVQVVDSTTEAGKESLRNYFENGILIPLTIYFRKTFAIAHFFSGDELLDIRELIIHMLATKILISDYKIPFWPMKDNEDNINKQQVNNVNENDIAVNSNNNSTEESEQMINGYNRSKPMIIGDFCFNEVLLQQTELDYNQVISTKFTPFDYTILYQITEHNLFSIVDNLESPNVAHDFGDSGEINNLKALKQIELENNPHYDTMSDTKKRIIRAFYIYKIGKEAINDERSCLFGCLPEICLEFETNFRNLLITILIYNGEKWSNDDQYARSSYFLLYKLLSIETTETQSDIISLLGGIESEKLGFMTTFAENLFQRLMILFIEDFNPQDRQFSIDYIIAFNLIKIFKFLCEEHNNFFQGRLIKSLDISYSLIVQSNFAKEAELAPIIDSDEKSNIKFFDFMLHVLAKLILVSKWEKISDNTIKNIDYHFDLFAAILELLIETIQGNKPEYLSKIGNTYTNLPDDDNTNNSFLESENSDSFQQFVEFVTDILFRNDCSNEFLFQIRNQLMLFFTAILEEKNCNEDVQKFIIKHLNLNKVISSISSILRIYYYDNCTTELAESQTTSTNVNGNTPGESNQDENVYKREKTVLPTKKTIAMKTKTRPTIKFNQIVYDYLTKAYFYEDFSKTNEFQLANIFYRYIKLISVQKKSDEASELIRRVGNISVSEANKKFNYHKEINKGQHKAVAPMNLINENVKSFDDDFIEKFYIVKFFESITQTVEVRTGDKSSMNQTVIFTVLPQMIYLSTGTKTEFIKRVNRDSETTKKNDLIRHITYFQKEIKYYQKFNDRISRLLSSIDFTYIQTGLYVYAAAFNLFMMFTLTGDMRKTPSPPPAPSEERRLLRSLTGSTTEGFVIQEYINDSIAAWAGYYNALSYFFTTLNGFFIIMWIIFRMPLYYRLDKIKFMEVHKMTDKSQLNIWHKARIAIVDTIYVRDYITSLLYMFVVSLIGSILHRGEIAYPFLLLAVVNLNPTLKNIIVSIKMKYLELLLTYLLAFTLMFVYANIGFFFFNEDFNAVLDGYDDNFCTSLVFCFLSTLDYALRNRGGIGDLMTRISFERHTGHYIGRIFFDVTFFLLIVIIMIDLVFGIIIESFQELRNNEQKHDNDKKSHCFICHVNRGTVEKNRQDFNEHREKTHNLWSYVNYMISLKFSDIHDLNAINSYARDKLDNKNINWLPTFKDQGKDDQAGSLEENEENLKVEEENIIKHLVKEA